jgi:CBS domain-containing protein
MEAGMLAGKRASWPSPSSRRCARPPALAIGALLFSEFEKMRARDLGSALVADYGRLIGILTSRDLLRAFAARVHRARRASASG